MERHNDPFGQAILDYSKTFQEKNLIVESDICDDDILPVSLLFREYEEMPELEQMALSLAKGKVLDIGAAAGCHSSYLKHKNIDITAIEISPGAAEYVKSLGIPCICDDILNLKNQKFDTLLLLMNGAGMCGQLKALIPFFAHLKSILKEDGQIICDSSDLKYLFEEEDGSFWMDLNSDYYGEVQFNVKYEGIESGWFNWMYIDFKTLKKSLKSIGLKAELIKENENNHYLARITND